MYDFLQSRESVLPCVHTVLVQTLQFVHAKVFRRNKKAIEKLKHTHFNIYIHIVYFKLAPRLQKMFFFIQGGIFLSQWPNFDALAGQ